MKTYEVLSYFNNVLDRGNGQYMARCPCHDDHKPSLSITEKRCNNINTLFCWM